MKIIYTLDTDNGKRQFTDFWLKLAELSVFHSNKLPYEVELYTDFQGHKMLQLHTNCKFDAVHIVDFARTPHHPDWWNFAKLVTYSMQTEPFLHIDFDVILQNGFTIPEDFGICTEMLREYSLQTAFREHAIFSTGSVPPRLICSGLLGGTGVNVLWRDLLDQAAQQCTKPTRKDAPLADLVAVEEFNLSQLAQFYNVPVYELDRDKFTHFQGGCKEQRFRAIINRMYNATFNHKTE